MHQFRYRLHRLLRRLADPGFYLRAVMVIAALWLVILPFGADGTIAGLRPARMGTDRCRILQVIDGDTIRLWCGDTPVRARITGYDAPEVFSPGCAAEAIAGQRATWALRRALLGARDIQITGRGRDKYDRPLVQLRLDGADVSANMIRAGHGRAYQGGRRGGWCGTG